MTDLTFLSAPSSGFWRRFQRHKGAVIGGSLLVLVLLAVLIGPFLWPHAAGQINLTARNLGPSLSHPIGTDHLGRDLFAAILQGGRVTLLVGVVAMALSVLIGGSGWHSCRNGPLARCPPDAPNRPVSGPARFTPASGNDHAVAR